MSREQSKKWHRVHWIASISVLTTIAGSCAICLPLTLTYKTNNSIKIVEHLSLSQCEEKLNSINLDSIKCKSVYLGDATSMYDISLLRFINSNMSNKIYEAFVYMCAYRILLRGDTPKYADMTYSTIGNYLSIKVYEDSGHIISGPFNFAHSEITAIGIYNNAGNMNSLDFGLNGGVKSETGVLEPFALYSLFPKVTFPDTE